MKQDGNEANMHALFTADRREFLKISQAVGVGFLVMGVIGYVVKLSTLHAPIRFSPPICMAADDCSTHSRQQHSCRRRLSLSLPLF